MFGWSHPPVNMLQTYAPELFLVETTPEMRASFPFSEASSERSDSRVRERLEPMHTGETTKSDTSVFNDRKPIPPIRQQTSTVSLATQTGNLRVAGRSKFMLLNLRNIVIFHFILCFFDI